MRTFNDMANDPTLTTDERLHYASLAAPRGLPVLLDESRQEVQAELAELRDEYETGPDLYAVEDRLRIAAEQARLSAEREHDPLRLQIALSALEQDIKRAIRMLAGGAA